MDFDLSEEQRLLKESVDGLLNSSYDFDARKKHAAEKGGWSKSAWSKLAEQGLLGLPFSEDDGGFGAGPIETMIVMEALGKALVLEPYLATVVIGGGFLRRGGSAEQKTKHIPGIIDGSKTFGFAQLEKNSRYDLQDVSATAKKKGAGWVIDGEKFVVLNGETADTLIVTARTRGGQRDAGGIGVFLVPGDAKGIGHLGLRELHEVAVCDDQTILLAKFAKCAEHERTPLARQGHGVSGMSVISTVITRHGTAHASDSLITVVHQGGRREGGRRGSARIVGHAAWPERCKRSTRTCSNSSSGRPSHQPQGDRHAQEFRSATAEREGSSDSGQLRCHADRSAAADDLRGLESRSPDDHEQQHPALQGGPGLRSPCRSLHG